MILPDILTLIHSLCFSFVFVHVFLLILELDGYPTIGVHFDTYLLGFLLSDTFFILLHFITSLLGSIF